ncbi:hypothetical protein AWC38_SpisGene9516 [Stylophora pistillata]|uniref:Core-binding (CB) domain-containing protein n=1 Tax=Stylophora pistillata TaxID=50429 RepID=A0A2B4S8W2_STYPI|nr:hypothetical protein AWC38_SpisGene9516 [Stylophora pistillata]
MEKFLEEFAKREYHPKTTKSCLMSLRHFYSFCLSETLDIDISPERFLSLNEKVTRWPTSLRKGCSKRHWEKMEVDLHALISPEEIEKFQRSQDARDTICLLGQLAGARSVEISQSQYTLIQDFFLVKISIDNPNRAGALANMKLGELNRASKQDEENVVFVKDHKTLSTHGPARIVPGEAMASSQINETIKSVWKKSEGSPSSTLFRKSAVSKVHTTCQSNEARGNLADLMAHNIETARKCYRLQEESKSSVKASKHPRSVMRGQCQQNLDEQEVSPTISSLSVSEQCASETSRASWNKEIEDLVKSVCKDEIESEAFSMEDVESKISDHP